MLTEQELWFKILDEARDRCCLTNDDIINHRVDFASWLVIQYGIDPQMANDYVTAWEWHTPTWEWEKKQ